MNIGGRFSAAGGGFLDGPAAQWVEQLLPLVIDDGVGTFILASDDPATMQHFAEEVAPALREAVARELRHADAATVAEATWVGRSTAVRAKRRAGIDYDALPGVARGARGRARRRRLRPA